MSLAQRLNHTGNTSAICPICLSSDISEIRVYRSRESVFENLSLVECRDCDFVFADPMPSDDDLALYNSSYFFSAHDGKPKSDFVKAFFSGIAGVRIRFIEDYLLRNNIDPRVVLELGPGPGYLCQKWLEKYPDSRYKVVETDSSCYEDLKAIGVDIVDHFDLSAAGQDVDLLILSHVLEHVADPKGFLNKFIKLLKPGGAIFVEVPCQDWKHQKVDEPHLLFFEKKSMHKLLSDLGFTDIQLSYHGRAISQLAKKSIVRRLHMLCRNWLISREITWPFRFSRQNIDGLNDPLEKIMIAPFKPHKESMEPAWWLRAVAIKA